LERLTLVVKNDVINIVRYLITTFLVFSYLSSESFAAYLEEFSEPTITAVATSASYDLYVDPYSGTTSESSPITAYVPIGNSGGDPDNYEYTFHAITTTDSNVNFLNKNGTIYSGSLRFNFNVVLDGAVSQYINLAWENDSGEWEVFNADPGEGGPVQTSSNGTNTFTISFEKLCSVSNAPLDCDDSFENTSNNPSATEELMVFAFVDDDNKTGADINPSDYTGVFYKLKFSNKIYSSSRIYLNSLSKGDTKLYASFDGFDITDDYLKTYVYLRENSTTEEDPNISTSSYTMLSEPTTGASRLSLSSLTDIDSTQTSGSLTIPNLTNDVNYSVRIVFCDKYGFCSRLSNAKSERPEPLEALLEGQACYLLTAGFEGGHEVIDFFRVFRDKVLSKFFFGQAFTQLYYNTAPSLTDAIAKSSFLKSSIRFSACILYSVFKYWWVWLTLLITTLIVFIKRGEQYGRP
jgi:hypothetical protein